MNTRSTVILLLTLFLTFLVAYGSERVKRGGAMHHKVTKSEEKIKFTEDRRLPHLVSCALPSYRCCTGSPRIMKHIVSEKCSREDGSAGLCCNSDGLTEVEVIFGNGTAVTVAVNEPPNLVKPKFDSLAEEIAKSKQKTEEDTIDEITRL